MERRQPGGEDVQRRTVREHSGYMECGSRASTQGTSLQDALSGRKSYQIGRAHV